MMGSDILARIEYLRVQNFRALRDVEFKDLKPLTVLLGPNGSGKSSVFDVAFISRGVLRLGFTPSMGQSRTC